MAAPLNEVFRKGQPTQLQEVDEPKGSAVSPLVDSMTSANLSVTKNRFTVFSLDTHASEVQVGCALFHITKMWNRSRLDTALEASAFMNVTTSFQRSNAWPWWERCKHFFRIYWNEFQDLHRSIDPLIAVLNYRSVRSLDAVETSGISTPHS